MNALAVQDYPKKPCSCPHPLHTPPPPPPSCLHSQHFNRSSEWRLRLATGDQVVSRVSSPVVVGHLCSVSVPCGPVGRWAGGPVDFGMGHLYFWILDWPPWVQPAAKVGAGAPPPTPAPDTPISPPHLKHTHTHTHTHPPPPPLHSVCRVEPLAGYTPL